MQDIWKLDEHCIWSGIVYSDQNGKNNMNGKRKGSNGEMGMLVPTLFH